MSFNFLLSEKNTYGFVSLQVCHLSRSHDCHIFLPSFSLPVCAISFGTSFGFVYSTRCLLFGRGLDVVMSSLFLVTRVLFLALVTRVLVTERETS
jgi:hypothetical protein